MTEIQLYRAIWQRITVFRTPPASGLVDKGRVVLSRLRQREINQVASSSFGAENGSLGIVPCSRLSYSARIRQSARGTLLLPAMEASDKAVNIYSPCLFTLCAFIFCVDSKAACPYCGLLAGWCSDLTGASYYANRRGSISKYIVALLSSMTRVRLPDEAAIYR